MALTCENIIKKVDVLPTLNGFTNVIKRVVVEVIFKDLDLNPNIESKGLVAAILNTDTIDSFITIENITDAQIIEWVYAEHGGQENFVSMVSEHHAQILQQKHECYGVQEYDRELQMIVEGTDEYDGLLG